MIKYKMDDVLEFENEEEKVRIFGIVVGFAVNTEGVKYSIKCGNEVLTAKDSEIIQRYIKARVVSKKDVFIDNEKQGEYGN
jgi:hypothetical protein